MVKNDDKDKKVNKTENEKRKKKLSNTIFTAIDSLSEEAEIASLNVGNKDKRTGKTIELIDINELTEAPKDWDKFPEPSIEQLITLRFSIIENGLIYPVVVWDRGDEKMILAGKTRTRTYKSIRDEGDGREEVDYSRIPSIVYEKDEISVEKAKNIIIESNTEQRKENTKDLPFIVKHNVERISNRKNKEGDTMDIVAKRMNLSRTKIYEEVVLAKEIDENIFKMYYDGILNRKTVLRFKKIDKSAQKRVYEKILKGMSRSDVKEKNLDERSKELRMGMNYEEIRECLTKDPEGMKVSVSFHIPSKYEDEFIEMVNNWLEERQEEE